MKAKLNAEMTPFWELNIGDIFFDELGERFMVGRLRHPLPQIKVVISMETGIISDWAYLFNENDIVDKVSNTH